MTGALRAIRTWSTTTKGQRWLIGVAFLILVAWYLAFAVQRYETSHFYGDEPDYYLNAVSVVEDGDLDLRNQFLDPDRRAFPGPLTFKVDPGGGPSPTNFMPTTSVMFIAPANAVGGVLGVLIVYAMMNIASLALLLVVLRRIVAPNPALAAIVIAGLSVPLSWHAASIWTEIPALLGVSAVLALLPRMASSIRAAGAVGLLLALLPWMHQKYVILAAGLIAAILLHPERRRFWPIVAGIPVAGFLGTVAFSYVLRGRWNFTISSATGDVAGTFDPRWTRNLAQPFAWFFDQTRGYLPYAPVWIVAMLGVVVLLRHTSGRRILGFLAIGFAPFMLVYMAGPFLGGDAPPGRETLTALPALVILLACGLASLRGVIAWTVAGAAGAVSVLGGTVPAFRNGMDVFFNNVGEPKLLNSLSSPRWNWSDLWPRITVDTATWSGSRLLMMLLLVGFAVATLYFSSRLTAVQRSDVFWEPPTGGLGGLPCIATGHPSLCCGRP